VDGRGLEPGGDDVLESSLENDDHEDLPDLSATRLIDLLGSQDPRLMAALCSLTESMRTDSTLTTGWNSFIGAE
jgi:hypothetical protein